MAAAGPAVGLALLVDAVEVESLASLDELYEWAELAGDMGDPRSLQGSFHRAFGGPTFIRDFAFVSGPDLEVVLRDARVPQTSQNALSTP